MTPEQVALLTDSRLSDAARVLGLHLSNLPEGEHELPHDKLAALLHGCPNRDTVGRHMRQLEVYDYVTRTSKGGSGSPRYRWSAREKSREDTALPAKIHGEGATVVVEEVVDIPPMSPVAELAPLAVDADALIQMEAATLGEAVKPLISYLRRRVTPLRQEPYVGWVVGVLNPNCMNPSWKDATGMPVPQGRRATIVAIALNELATADEKTRTWGEGDVGNLRNKLNGLIRLENAPPIQRKATGTDGRTSKRDQPADAQDYKPTRWSGEFNR